MRITRNRPDTQAGPPEQFNGTVPLDEIAAPEPPSHLALVEAAEDGATIHWHTDAGFGDHPTV
ncbi:MULTISPECIES: hypothetical protein [Streptomyces]|uniref:hypothetical protein n=1 Tax=Streptomyces TaxID=1883 RepID=UPI001A95343D|nr:MULTISPECIES: hypothetical protein [Streptomyces]MBO0914152.1 hypothetical protein [Streptomyces laculatispora]MCX4774537.1 hypothetical protein [Streptomyces sp. NBC_01285]